MACRLNFNAAALGCVEGTRDTMFRTHRLLPALLLAVVATATPACASSGGWSGNYPQGRRVSVDPRAYDVGYREGFEQGRDDARRGRAFDYSRHGEYRDGDRGYNGGNRNTYRRVFRDGFAAGYDDAYRQFARGNGRTGGWNGPNGPRPGNTRVPAPRGDRRFGSLAVDNGYRDGYAQGREDARDGDRYDPRRAKRYRDGDHDYNDRYGSRDDYKRDYRDAFQRGYDQGYREIRRR